MDLNLLDLINKTSKNTPVMESGSTEMFHLQKNADCFTQVDSCPLFLGLGPTPNFYCDDHRGGVDNAKRSTNLFGQSLVSGGDSEMLKLELSRRNVEPVLAPLHNDLGMVLLASQRSQPITIINHDHIPTKNADGYMPALFAPRPEKMDNNDWTETQGLLDLGSDASMFSDRDFNHQVRFSPELSATTDCSVDATSSQAIVRNYHDQRIHNQHYPKKCMSKGCSKGARGASGLCIAHGGGQRCQKPGCNKGAESRTAYCKAHGGGKRCQRLGCTKSAEGKTEFCIAHGGGRRCGYSDCTKAARGKSGLCIRHGGGKRCSVEGCARSAEGQAGLCISHGGGRRCQYAGCNKGAQGSTLHCKAHGGGKRCIFEGCNKGAEGSTPLCKGHGGGKRCLFEGGGFCPKSVHGGTDYCVAHGGGKRCTVAGCTKSARGRTDCCVRHGGGKRCQVEGCGKSAQGSTDYCKAHGGGKRCTWIQGCDKFARGKSGLCAAHGSMMVSQQVSAATTTVGSSMVNDGSFGDSAISDCAESSGNVGRRQFLVHPQPVVPLPMKLPSSPLEMGGDGAGGEAMQDICYGFAIPEGRVHGGGLMSLLGRSLKKNGFDSGRI